MKEKFNKFVEKIKENNLNVKEVLVWDNGIIFKHIFKKQNKLHQLNSISKYVTGLCVIKAIEQNLLSLETFVMDYFKDIEIYNKENIQYLKDLKIKHLLTLTIGQEKQIHYDRTENNRNESHASYILNYPIKHKSGTFFFYSNADDYLLSAIIQKITGKSLLEYAKENIFLPMGITESNWETCDNGICLGGAGLELKIDDLLKIALLLKNDGKHEDKQIVKADFVKDMKTIKVSRQIVNYPYQSKVFPKFAYGYNVWLTNDGNYFADGKLGQFMFIIPQKNRIILTVSNEENMREIVNSMECLK